MTGAVGPDDRLEKFREHAAGTRWALPATLLVVEYLVLSVLVDATDRPELLRWATIYRLMVPTALGAAVAGWLVAHSRRPTRPPLADPPWRYSWSGLLGNLAVFALALGIVSRAFGPGAPPVTPDWVFPALLALGVAAVVLAATIAWPVPSLVAHLRGLTPALPTVLVVGLSAAWIAVHVRGAWDLLAGGTLTTVGVFLRLAGGEVLLIPTERVVGLGAFEVEIAPQCSGIEGIGLIILFVSMWLALARDRLRFPRALLLLPLGAVAAFLANAIRIAILVQVGAAGHESLALGGLHSRLGWILSVVLSLGIVALAERTPWLMKPLNEEGPGLEAGVPAHAGAYLGPLLAAIATALVTGIWSTGAIDEWYGARVVAASVALVVVRRSLPALRPTPSWIPALIGVGVALVWISGADTGGDSVGRAVDALGRAPRAAWIAIHLVGSIFVIPLAEELAFRGLLLPWLVSPDVDSVPPRAWTWPAVILSSLAFGALHSEFLLGTLAGLAFALARLWRGRLGDAVVAHAVANAGVALAVLCGGRWELWS